jgi:HEAT repeat protein
MRTLKRILPCVLILSAAISLSTVFILCIRRTSRPGRTEIQIEQLQSFNRNLRAQAAEALGRAGDKRAVVHLVAALTDDDSDVRQKAAEALDRLGWQAKTEDEQQLYFVAKKEWDKCLKMNPVTMKELIKAMSDRDPEVRKKAAETLGKMENPAVEPLVAALRDDDERVRDKAAEALIKIGGLCVTKSFIVALRDKNPNARERAAQALGRIGDSCAIRLLVAALNDTNWQVREKAAQALGRIGDSNAVGPLAAAMDDEDSDVRQKAAEALDSFGWKPGDEGEKRLYLIAKKQWDECLKLDGVTVKALAKVLKDKNPEVRREASETLAKIGDLRTMQALIISLQSDNSDIRKEAAETLGNIGHSEAVKPLTGLLRDMNPDVRRAAAEALVKIGGLTAIEELIVALKDSDSYVREAAAEILGRISNPALDPLMYALWEDNWQVRIEAAKALGQLRDSRAVNSLIAVLKYEKRSPQQGVTQDLSRIAGSLSEPFAAPAAAQDTRLRIEVIKALGAIGDKRAVPALIDELQNWNTGPDAADALKKLGWSAESVEQQVHWLVANRDGNALRQNWDRTKLVLSKDLKSDDDKVFNNALFAFIALGRDDTTQELIDTLKERGGRTVAASYVNCGNKRLSDAAMDWAKKNRVFITTDSVASPVSWDSW